MRRLIGHIKELLSDIWRSCKAFFYDSYSGWKKKRIAIVSGVLAGVVAVVVVFVVVVPRGALMQTVSSGVEKTIDALLPEAIARDVKQALGMEPTYDMFYYPELEDDFTYPTDTGESYVIAKEQKKSEGEWVWEGSWGPPVQGDIVATEGKAVSKNNKEAQSGNTNQTTGNATVDEGGRYSTWRTQVELQNLVLLETKRIQDNVLLQINNAVSDGSWESFTVSARSILVDVPSLGEQIRANMSGDTVALWTQLELAYSKLYSEIYACESGVDLSNIASSMAYRQALDLTTQFLLAVEAEKEAQSN